MTPNNIEFYATFLSPTVDVQERVIHFGPGVDREEMLLQVPIGQIDPHATIVITVGLQKSHPNDPSVDSDPGVGISAGTDENLFLIVDVSNYAKQSPCYPISRIHDNTRVPAGTPVSATYKLTFTPFNKLGICETAQDGGYINTGTFGPQIDITQPLFLTVRRHDAPEEYFFHYFNVEIY